MGRLEGIEPSSVEPQSTVLPLNYSRHKMVPPILGSWNQLVKVLRVWGDAIVNHSENMVSCKEMK